MAKRNIAARIILGTVYGVAVFCIPSNAIAAGLQNNNKAALAEFQALYDGLTKAYLAKDVERAGKFFSDDYDAGDYSHPLNKQKTLDNLRKWNGVFRTTSRKLQSVIVNGKKATTVVDTYTEGKLADAGGVHVYVIKGRNMDTWVHNPAGWQLKHARVLKSGTTKDGKPLPSHHLGG